MKPSAVFSIRRRIAEIPSHKLSKQLLAAYCIVYLALPLILIPSQWGDKGIIGMMFNQGRKTFSEPERVSIVLQSVGFVLFIFVGALLVVGLFFYLAVKILTLFKIQLDFWKIGNLYLYAKIWSQGILIILGLILFAVAPKLESVGVGETTLALAAQAAVLIPAIFFYTLFIFGLIQIFPKKAVTNKAV